MSNQLTISPNTTDIGFGTYFFTKDKGKFLGGLYMEAPDINDNLNEFKGESETSPFFERIKIGIVAKFTFSSIIDFN